MSLLSKRVGLIGAGAAGSAMLLALKQKGAQISGIASRSIVSAERCAALVGQCTTSTQAGEIATRSDLIIIATPDDAISGVAEQIAQTITPNKNQLYIHLSGALTSDELSILKDRGAQTLSVHPIQAFSDPRIGAQLIAGSYFCLEGESPAREIGKAWVDLLGGHSICIDKTQKQLYHTALSISSNYLIAIEYVATELLEKAGINRHNALKAIEPLIQGSVSNLLQSGLPDALTGPISRGDSSTIQKHLSALNSEHPNITALYKLLGLTTVDIAKQKGKANIEGLEKIKQQLEGPPKKIKKG